MGVARHAAGVYIACMDPLVNKTGRAITAYGVLLFCLGTITWLLLYGQPSNSLHVSALSWSFTTIAITMVALGVNVTTETVTKLLGNTK